MIKTIKLMDSFFKKEKDTYTFRFQLLDNNEPYQFEQTSVPRFIMELSGKNVVNKIVAIEDYDNGIITFDLNEDLKDGTFDCEVVVTTEAMVETFPTIGYQKFQIYRNLDDAMDGSTIEKTEFEIIIERIEAVEIAIGTKANILHEHISADITDLQSKLDQKSNVGHKHEIADTNNLQATIDAIGEELDTKAHINDVDELEQKVDANKTELQNLFADNTNAIAVNAEDILENADAIAELESTKAEKNHIHPIDHIVDLNHELNKRALATDLTTTNANVTANTEAIATINNAVTETTALTEPINEIANAGNFVELESVQGNTLQNLLWFNTDSIYNTDVKQTLDSSGYVTVNNNQTNFINTCDLLKTGTQYTLILDIAENTITDGTFVITNTEANEAQIQTKIIVNKNTPKGVNKFLVTTVSDFSPTNKALRSYLHSDSESTAKVKYRLMLLEGDYTNRTIPPYFEGIQSATESENNELQIKTVGKNLFDVNKIKLGTNQNVTINGNTYNILPSYANSLGYSEGFKLLKPNTQYTISAITTKNTTSNSGNIAFYNSKTQQFIFFSLATTDYTTFTSPNDINDYTSIYLYGYNDKNSVISNIQIEEGTTATAYEPYKETTLQIPLNAPLMKLPNGVADEIVNGKIVRRIKEIVIDGNDNNLVASATFTNTVRFYYDIPNIEDKHIWYNYGKTNTLTNNLPMIHGNFWSEDTEHYYMDGTGNGRIVMFLNVSKLSSLNLAGIKEYLQNNPITLYYELETPVEEEIAYNEILETYQDGHILLNGIILPTVNVTYNVGVVGRLNKNETEIADNRQMLENVLTVNDVETYWNNRKGW